MTYPEKINIYSLAVEVTENCNMLCPHCLRGDARDKDIDIDKFNIFLSRIKSIDKMVITGGEPLLRPEGIKSIINSLRGHGIDCDTISMITNGTHNKEIPEILDYCNDFAYTYIIFSNDMYHQMNPELAHKLTKTHYVYPLVTDSGEHGLINIGRAKNLSCDKKVERIITKAKYNEGYNGVTNAIISFTCDGDIILGTCNYEYDEIETLRVTNVSEPDWYETMMQEIIG